MRRFKGTTSLVLVITLSGCATMNSDFSCNNTAKDSCLTIEQVDALTRFADEPPLTAPKARHHTLYKADINEPLLWVAPRELG